MHMTAANLPIKRSIKAAIIQHSWSAETVVQQLETALANAHQQGAQLALLPELHHHPYFCQSEDLQYFALAEPIPGPTTEQLSQWAKQFKLMIIGSIFEKRMSGVYHNTAVVIEPDGHLAGCYRKMHIPDDPGFYEKFYFTPGDCSPGFTPIDTHLGRLGILVCWDQWYPEAARLMALAGAELLVYPTAIGWSAEEDAAQQQLQVNAWQCIQRSHAIANHLPVLCANRWGFEPHPTLQTGIEFWGQSFAYGPQGEVLIQAPANQDAVLITDLPLGQSEPLRQIWPFFRDRRIDAYSNLTKRCLTPKL